MSKFEPTVEVVGMEKPLLDTSIDRMIVVLHVPVVKTDKFDKLCSVMKKLMQKEGLKLASHESSFFMPKDAENVTKGVVFAEYENAEMAATAVKNLTGVKLDSRHILEAFPLSDFEKTRDLPDEFVPPEIPPFVENDRDFSWLDDEKIMRGCEMFATQIGSEKSDKNVTSICVFNPKDPEHPITVVRKEKFCPPGFSWSPQGTYFVAMTSMGAIALNVSGTGIGEKPKIKMECKGVSRVDFSAKERYAFTRTNMGKKAELWDVAKGEYITTLEDSPDKLVIDPTEHFCVRPANPDTEKGKKGGIELYNIEKKEFSFISVPGMTLMSMSPRDPYVATYSPESGNQGASIRIIDITNGKTLRTHTLYKALSCQFYWHPEGHYLAAQSDSYIKGKRLVSCLILFRMDEREIPTQVVDEKTQRITTFAWEPAYGTRFAYSSTEAAETSNSFGKVGNVSIYDMRCYGSQAIRLRVLEKKPSSRLSWSPHQGILLLCDLITQKGSIEFYDVESNTVLSEFGHYNNGSTTVQWESSGRFVAFVSPSFGSGSGDAGYDIYSFTGYPAGHVVDMSFTQFLWRPRPSCPFDGKKMQRLRDNLPKYREEFQREEKQESEKSANVIAQKLQEDSNKFQALMKGLLEQYDREAGRLREISNGFDARDPERFEIVSREVVEVPTA